MQRVLCYRATRTGVEMAPKGDLPRHHHRDGYATIVLSGSFIEASFSGRSETAPGDVLLHGRFDCHANTARSTRAQILRLPWTNDALEGHFRVRDPDALARLAESDPTAASLQLAAMLEPAPAAPAHWTESLAEHLSHDDGQSLGSWAEKSSLSPESLSRGFRRVFGVSPQLFRLQARTRRAWRAIVSCSASLTSIAHAHGFADLAHMSRSVTAFTSLSPMAWRSAAACSRRGAPFTDTLPLQPPEGL